ncbi:hypothetical protein B0H63DRAFT_538563 [Podospora didyma]|uniref:Oxidoreductase acuF-like C2H2 type zinc-finger domain-containing protein n=1 Tax=Podospora didyma TaxID=330526 RepID=A0AAE0U476_9PEZI|nr:hypothetical protein B0H63DRAFT_538563 [Podospora didyma]
MAEPIKALFRLGILVRKTGGPTDRFKRALQMSSTTFIETTDINYVTDKHPKMGRACQGWLSTRLGRAIAQRRTFIKYSRDHKARLAFQAPVEPETRQQILETWTELQSSKASTFHLDSLSTSPKAWEGDDELPENEDDDVSVMSASTMSHALSVLKLPQLAELSSDREPFECPTCYTLQSFQREKSWRVHAFRDLKAYVCTAGGSDCDTDYFSDRNTWFEHEIRHHIAAYACTLCQGPKVTSQDNFRAHLVNEHHHFSEQQMETLQDVSRQIPSRFLAEDCPFCDDWGQRIHERQLKAQDPKGKWPSEPSTSDAQKTTTLVSATRFKRHVALHQEQLAIFAMSRAAFGGDNEEAPGSNVTLNSMPTGPTLEGDSEAFGIDNFDTTGLDSGSDAFNDVRSQTLSRLRSLFTDKKDTRGNEDFTPTGFNRSRALSDFLKWDGSVKRDENVEKAGDAGETAPPDESDEVKVSDTSPEEVNKTTQHTH